MTNKRVVNLETDRSQRGEFDDAIESRPGDAPVAPTAASVPPVDGSEEDIAGLFNDLRNLCEEALLKPLDCPSKRHMRALERRDDPKGQVFARPRERGTTDRIADEMSVRLDRTPHLRALLADRLRDAPGARKRPMSGAEHRSLREVMDFLDRLGCPRSGDDRHFTAVERIRWLLDVMSASSGAHATILPPGLDHTPATSQNRVLADPAASQPDEDAAP
ncbi:MAG: hypothetical protein H0V44_11340 [Planctomycetes bacterium]|nr:hypothetical protein [Planctomycetota bacterium]